MKNFQAGVFVWIFGCIKFSLVMVGVIALFKALTAVKMFAINSPVTAVLIGIGVIALLTLVHKIKKG